MGTGTLVEDIETKSDVKSKGQSNNQHGRRTNTNQCDRYIHNEMCLGVDSDLHGYVLKAKRNQSEQATNFTAVDDIVNTHVGTKCDPFVLKSLEQEIE